MFRLLLLIAASIALIGCQQAQAEAQLTDQEREDVRQIVRDYILENPEIIEEALIELQRRAQQRELAEFNQSLDRYADAIFNDPRDPRIGPDNADVVVVEFMDYKCSYCRVAAGWVDTARKTHGDRIQFIFKEFPILGPDSLEAARAAIAAHRQGEGVYMTFHKSMLNASGPLPSSRIDQLAALAGVNVDQMRADMEDPAIMSHIGDVRSLGQNMGVSGTPFFIINGEVIRGANELAFEQALQMALAD